MTPLQVAKAECANCDSAGNCAGIGIADNGSLYRFRQPGKCWLAPDGNGQIKRCQYFEESVAPLAKKRMQTALPKNNPRQPHGWPKECTHTRRLLCQLQPSSLPSASVASGRFIRLSGYAHNALRTARLKRSANGGLRLEKMGLPKP
jgi:hypothetical protein